MSHKTTTSTELLDQIRKLDSAQQVEPLQEFTEIARQNSPKHGKRSILELEGLGAEIWAGIDAREYVRQEREG